MIGSWFDTKMHPTSHVVLSIGELMINTKGAYTLPELLFMCILCLLSFIQNTRVYFETQQQLQSAMSPCPMVKYSINCNYKLWICVSLFTTSMYIRIDMLVNQVKWFSIYMLPRLILNCKSWLRFKSRFIYVLYEPKNGIIKQI